MKAFRTKEAVILVEGHAKLECVSGALVLAAYLGGDSQGPGYVAEPAVVHHVLADLKLQAPCQVLLERVWREIVNGAEYVDLREVENA